MPPSTYSPNSDLFASQAFALTDERDEVYFQPAVSRDHGWADLVLLAACVVDFDSAEDFVPQDDHVFDDSPAYSIASPINPRSVNRTQMLSNFLDAHCLGPRAAVGLNSYLSALPNLDLSLPLLQYTIDALCYAESSDYYSQMESRACYASAISLLQREVGQPPTQLERRRPVLLSMLMLCLYDLSARRQAGWATHLYGAQIYMKACGPSILSAPMDLLIFHNLRLCAVCLGMIERKAVPLASPQWMKVAHQYSTRNWKGVLFDIAVNVPAILEKADEMLKSEKDLRDLCDRIGTARRSLELWIAHKSSEDSAYQIVHSGSMRRFSGLLRDSTFHAVFHFRSIETCRLYGLAWICSAMLHVEMLRILDTLGTDSHMFGNKTWSRSEVESQVFVFATSLCRIIPFCYENAPQFVTWYLKYAEQFLRSCDSAQTELAWCAQLRQVLDLSRNQRQRNGSCCNDMSINIPTDLSKVDPVFLMCSAASDNPLV